MKKTVLIYLKALVFSLLPAMCTIIATSSILDQLMEAGYIGHNINIENTKNVFSVVGVVLTFLLLTQGLIIAEIRENRYRNQSRQLIRYNKEILVNTLSEYIGKEYCDLNIRIFVPYKSLKWRVMRIINKNTPLLFCIKNVEGLAEPGFTSNLKFCVEPNGKVEGLVGECYQHKKMLYDDNLEQTNSTSYSLTEYQKSKTNDLKFIIVCPTFSRDKEVDAIIAFDSRNHIKINEPADKFTTAILNFTQQLHEYVPELFKAKGGIL